MKKAILSPLCSALVIPGLGQIINQEIKKGILLLACVFVLLIVFAARLAKIITAAVDSGLMNSPDPALLIEKAMTENVGTLWLLLATASLLWLYSVIDAFLGGRKADRTGETA